MGLYLVSTKLFELAHLNPPTHRLLAEAIPLMQKLSGDLDQACHMTVYNQGKQIVIAKIDAPSGVGFSVRLGAQLDVLLSASGRVLLAFQDEETRQARIQESRRASPHYDDPQIGETLAAVRARGFESIASNQVRGPYAISFPILDSRGQTIAALVVPYTERIDKTDRKSIAAVEGILGIAAQTLSARIGGAGRRQF